MNLCQLATVKARLNIDEFETAHDTLLANLIEWVSARFERECGRSLARAADTTEEFAGDDTELRVSRYPIESVSAFALKTDEDTGWETQTGVDYLIRRSCIISLPAALGSWSQQLRVTYTGGYVLPGDAVGAGQTALPDDLEHAAIEQVAHWWQRRDFLGLVSISADGGAVTQFGKLDLLPNVLETLKSYRRF